MRIKSSSFLPTTVDHWRKKAANESNYKTARAYDRIATKLLQRNPVEPELLDPKKFPSLKGMIPYRDNPVALVHGDGVFHERFLRNLTAAFDAVSEELQKEPDNAKTLEILKDFYILCAAAKQRKQDSFNEQVAALTKSLSLKEKARAGKAMIAVYVLWNAAEHAEMRWKIEQKEAYSTSFSPRPGSIEKGVYRLHSDGKYYQEALEVIQKLRWVDVSTSHPNKAMTRQESDLQVKAQELFLDFYRFGSLGGLKDSEAYGHLRFIAYTLFSSSEPYQRPSIHDDSDRLREYLSTNAVQATGDTAVKLHRALEYCYPASYNPTDEAICFRDEKATWTGLDADGNINSNSETARVEPLANREKAMQIQLGVLRGLEKYFVISRDNLRNFNEESELARSIKGDAAQLGISLTPPQWAAPYQTKLKLMQEKIKKGVSYRSESFDEDRKLLLGSMKEHGLERIAKEEEVIRSFAIMKTYGLHLVSCDARQGSVVANATTAALLHEHHYASLNEEAKVKLLTEELLKPSTPAEGLGALAGLLETLDERIPDPLLLNTAKENLKVLESIRKAAEIDPKLIKSYILSMTMSLSNMLELLYTFKKAGIFNVDVKGKVTCSIDISPLFETIEALKKSGEILKGFRDNPVGQAYLGARKASHGGQNYLRIVWGFSDGNRDGGKLAATVEIELAREESVKVLGVDFVHEDLEGRGGSWARGFMRLADMILNYPSTFWDNIVSATTQGERVDGQLRTAASAVRQNEQVFEAMIERALSVKKIDPEYREFARIAKEEGYRVYREMIDFLTGSPELWNRFVKILQFFAGVKSANRAILRVGKKLTFDNTRAIPWVGGWRLVQLMVSSLYGSGSGLQKAIKEKPGVWPAVADPKTGHPSVSVVVHGTKTQIRRVNFDIAKRWGLGKAFLRMIADEYRKINRYVTNGHGNGNGNGTKTAAVVEGLMPLREPLRDAATLMLIDLLRETEKEPDKAEEIREASQSLLRAVMIANQEAG